VSGTAAFTVPFGGPRSGFLFSPSVTESDTPNFTVAVLNTQEFYNGILRPISPQLISYYISQGYSRNVLFTLLISEIEKENLPPFYNVPGKYYEDFIKELEGLIDEGLTVQPIDDDVLLGPPLTAKEVQRMDIAKLDAQQITIARDGPYYQLKKPNIVYRFCLKPATSDATGTCKATQEQSDGRPPDNSGKMGRYTLQLGKQKIGFHVRSVEGVIYYLGEWVREQVESIGGIANQAPTIADKSGRCREASNILFKLEQGGGQERSISTSYQGKDYHIDVDPKGCDRSSQVLELVLELLALNNSAKDLPAPSVIPILTR
jgi:hypothetical protein